jgi:hypothetical protein
LFLDGILKATALSLKAKKVAALALTVLSPISGRYLANSRIAGEVTHATQF